MVKSDAQQPQASVEVLKAEDDMGLAADFLWRYYAFQSHNEAIWRTQAVNLNISIGIVRMVAPSEITLQSMLSQHWPFEGNCGVRLVDVCMRNILEDLASSYFLTADFRLKYAQYIGFGINMIKPNSVFSPFRILGRDWPVAKNLDILHLVDPSV